MDQLNVQTLEWFTNKEDVLAVTTPCGQAGNLNDRDRQMMVRLQCKPDGAGVDVMVVAAHNEFFWIVRMWSKS